MKEIIMAVCDGEKILHTELVSQQRSAKVVMARDIARYLCSRLSSHSLAAIGRMFNSDHSTVLYSIRKTNRRIEANGALAAKIRRYESMLLAKR